MESFISAASAFVAEFLQDTIQENDACDWKGRYMKLENRQNEIIDTKLDEFKDKMNEINNKMDRFENMQKDDSMKKGKQIEGLQRENNRLNDKIETNIQFISCPYSLIIEHDKNDRKDGNNYNEKKQQEHDEHDEHDQDDKHYECDWKGTYVELINHIKICKYKYKSRDYEIINKELDDFKDEMNEINNKMDRFQRDNNHNTLNNKIERFQREQTTLNNKMEIFQNKEKEDMDELKRENDELRNEINTLKERERMNVIMIIGIICCVILAIIGWTVYKIYNDDHDHNMDEMVQQIDKINVTLNNWNDTMIKINVLSSERATIPSWNNTMKLYINSVSDLKTNCRKQINRLNSEISGILSWIDNIDLNVIKVKEEINNNNDDEMNEEQSKIVSWFKSWI